MKYQFINDVIALSSVEGNFYIELINSNVVRFTRDLSHASRVLSLAREAPRYSLKEGDGFLDIIGETFSLRVFENFYVDFMNKDGQNLLTETSYEEDECFPRGDNTLAAKEGHIVSGGEDYAFIHSYSLREGMHFYGLGDHTGPLDRLGYEKINWNTDYPQAHEDDVKSLYKSFPFCLISSKNGYFGIYLDNTFKSVFNFGVDERTFYFGATAGTDDHYFIYGPSPKDVVSRFTSFAGRLPLPPRWSLGNQQSRWSYPSKKSVEDVVAGYEKADIPLSAVNIDIDYMVGYRVFTVDETRFPDLSDFSSSLKKKGIRLIAILDPGLKVDPDYDVYASFVDNHLVAKENGKTYVNAVWPGDSVYPSFNDPKAREKWGEYCARVLSKGVSGLWCDMNEPASFKGPLPLDVDFAGESHAEIHNLYGYYMAMATYEGMRKFSSERPFVITRACFAGVEKYSVIWTGDNQSNWSSLQMSLPQMLNLGVSGMPFLGTDIGGFGGDCPAELMCRWIEFGAFSPFMRNHSCAAARFQEPYRYDDKTKAIYRKWVYFRYRLVPYLYDLFYEHSQNGLPALRPLYLEYPDDPSVSNLNDEFMLGESLLVAPVLSSGTLVRSVYLPKGVFYPFFGGEGKKGESYYAEKCPLDECLIYAKAGAIIPLYPSMTKNLDLEPEELVLKAFPGEGKYLHYQDNGTDFAYEKGEYNLYSIINHDGVVSVSLLHKGYRGYKRIRVVSPNGETFISLP